MKTLAVQISAALLVAGGLAALPGASSQANAATCPSTYVDSAPCGGPSSPAASASATATVTISAGPAVAGAHLSTTCSIAGLRRRALLTVTSSGGTVQGGSLEAKLHRVGTPSSKKRKVAVASYNGPITKDLAPGVWHGTMVYKPAPGSPFQYCGIVFHNLRITGAPAARHHSVKVPTSVGAGLRQSAS